MFVRMHFCMAIINQKGGTHFLQICFSQPQFHCCGVDIAGDWAKHNERWNLLIIDLDRFDWFSCHFQFWMILKVLNVGLLYIRNKQVWHRRLCSRGQLCHDKTRGGYIEGALNCYHFWPWEDPKGTIGMEAHDDCCQKRHQHCHYQQHCQHDDCHALQVPASCCASSSNVAQCQKSPTGANGAYTIGCWALIQVWS